MRLGAVAHVRDETTTHWWRFDDEAVTAMPGGPVGEHGDHGVASAERKVRRGALSPVPGRAPGVCLALNMACKDLQAEPAKASKRKPMRTEAGEDGEAGAALAAPSAPAPEAGRITSSNAYMLVYRRRGWRPPDGAAGAAVPPACGMLRTGIAPQLHFQPSKLRFS